MSGYGCFARHYDALTTNVDYAVRAMFFDEIIRRYHDKTELVLDLACGTGSLSIAMSFLNYDVIGVDSSSEMLSVAFEKTNRINRNILLLNQDIAKLNLFGSVDVTICALDSINHIEDERKVQKAFKRVSTFTGPGGLFIFDVNTPYKHRQILGNNTFVYDTPEVFCCWQNSYFPERDRVDILLDFFAPETDDGLYYRESESFSEWVYPDGTLLYFLGQAGFEHIATFEADSFSPPSQTAERLVYVARKPYE